MKSFLDQFYTLFANFANFNAAISQHLQVILIFIGLFKKCFF